MAAELPISHADVPPYITAMLTALTIGTPEPLLSKLPLSKRARTSKYTKKPDLSLNFFSLPLPVRKKIYRYALVVKKIVIHAFPLHKYVGRKLGTANIPLLRASKRVHSEAEEIFYSENTFVIMTGLYIASQARAIPRLLDKFLMIRRLEIVYDFRDWFMHCLDVSKSVREEATDLRAGIKEYKKTGDWMGVKTNLHSRKQLMKEWGEMTSRKFVKTNMTPADYKVYHDDQIENMGIFCYGHAMNVARDYMVLDCLILDYENFRCAMRCCHLAEESMKWGEVKGWHYGPPRKIVTWGTYNRKEDRAVMKAIMTKDEITFKYKSRGLKRRP